MGLRRFSYSAEGNVSPERFIRALTDMTPDRPKYWPGQTANQYKVLEKGETSALIREGTGTVWEQSRYDWSKPGRVVSTVVASNFLKPGTTWEFRVSARPGGGCRVDATLTRNFSGPQGLLVQALTYAPGGVNLVFGSALKRTLAILEREERTAG
jgi:hypothetical protein